MFRVAASSEEFRTCLVCSDRITAMHLGMDTCRACSSFFKRTKSLDRQYPCRQGDRNCVVTKDGKFTCRRCRYDKCVAVGMQYEGLMRVRAKKSASLIDRIETEPLLDRRKALEMDMIESSQSIFTRIPFPGEVLFFSREDASNVEMFQMSVRESFTFFKRVFPANCDHGDMEIIFKDFIGKFFMIDHYFRTVQTFGEIRKFILCSAITCIEVETFLDSEDGDSLNDLLMKSSARTYVDDEKSVFLPIFLQCQITEMEFFALLALIMSEIENPWLLSAETLLVLDEIRRSVFRELQSYYRKELGLYDYSVRIGNLMSLVHAMQECKSLFQVFFRFYSTIFDEQILADEKMKNLFR